MPHLSALPLAGHANSHPSERRPLSHSWGCAIICVLFSIVIARVLRTSSPLRTARFSKDDRFGHPFFVAVWQRRFAWRASLRNADRCGYSPSCKPYRMPHLSALPLAGHANSPPSERRPLSHSWGCAIICIFIFNGNRASAAHFESPGCCYCASTSNSYIHPPCLRRRTIHIQPGFTLPAQ